MALPFAHPEKPWHVLPIRLNTADRGKLQALADALGQTPTDCMRFLIRQAEAATASVTFREREEYREQ